MYTYNRDVVRNLNIIDEVEHQNAQLRDKRHDPTGRIKESAQISADYVREIKRQGKKDAQGNHYMDPKQADVLLDKITRRYARR